MTLRTTPKERIIILAGRGLRLETPIAIIRKTEAKRIMAPIQPEELKSKALIIETVSKTVTPEEAPEKIAAR